MWHVGIGFVELAALLLSVLSVILARGRARLWAVLILVFLTLGIVMTPADLLSTIVFTAAWVAASVIAATAAFYVWPRNHRSR